MRNPLLIVTIFLAVCLSSAQAKSLDNNPPSLLRCKRVANIGCSDDGVCIADAVRDKFPVTFDFKEKRYRSSLGTGRIHDKWDLPDGRHAIMTISPPASAEFILSPDWLSAAGGYSCERLK